jgi:hypothetical protein
VTLSGADELSLVDETVEKGKRLGAVQAGRRSDVAVGYRAVLGECDDDLRELGGAESQPGGRVERSPRW